MPGYDQGRADGLKGNRLMFKDPSYIAGHKDGSQERQVKKMQDMAEMLTAPSRKSLDPEHEASIPVNWLIRTAVISAISFTCAATMVGAGLTSIFIAALFASMTAGVHFLEVKIEAGEKKYVTYKALLIIAYVVIVIYCLKRLIQYYF